MTKTGSKSIKKQLKDIQKVKIPYTNSSIGDYHASLKHYAETRRALCSLFQTTKNPNDKVRVIKAIWKNLSKSHWNILSAWMKAESTPLGISELVRKIALANYPEEMKTFRY